MGGPCVAPTTDVAVKCFTFTANEENILCRQYFNMLPLIVIKYPSIVSHVEDAVLTEITEQLSASCNVYTTIYCTSVY